MWSWKNRSCCGSPRRATIPALARRSRRSTDSARCVRVDLDRRRRRVVGSELARDQRVRCDRRCECVARLRIRDDEATVESTHDFQPLLDRPPRIERRDHASGRQRAEDQCERVDADRRDEDERTVVEDVEQPIGEGVRLLFERCIRDRTVPVLVCEPIGVPCDNCRKCAGDRVRRSRRRRVAGRCSGRARHLRHRPSERPRVGARYRDAGPEVRLLRDAAAARRSLATIPRGPPPPFPAPDPKTPPEPPTCSSSR